MLARMFAVAALTVSVAAQTPSPDDLAAKVRVELAAARKLPAAIDRVVTPVIDRIWDGFDRQAAIGQVQFMDQYWRLAGNEGFDKSIDRVKARLVAAGFEELSERPKAPITVPSLWIEPAPTPSLGWDQQVATVAIVRDGQPDQIVLSREKERLALAINSFSTAPGGVIVPLIDVGAGGSANDYANKDVKGAVVVGTAGTGQLYTQAVVNRGAIGVISTAKAPAYLDPSPDLLQWGSITYDETRKPFGFRATPRAAATLKAAATAGAVKVRVEVATTFARKPERTLSAEIPGAIAPGERIVIAAHVQEPGANDNASGTATNMELARSLVTGVLSGRIPKPGRTLTFLWVNEISGSRRWLSEHPDEKSGVRYMFSMDMTGEDITKTGGHFLVERWPDPGAVWERPWDPHSEWGAGRVEVNTLKGDLINDLHLAMCERVAVKVLASTKQVWDVRTNPYEGGSDHTQFGSAGIPSLLDWHFTDRFYHTNRDTAEKTSPDEMRNVGTAVAASAWLMASATEPLGAAVRDLITRAGDARVKVELREGAIARPGVKPDENDKIVAAWRKWYDEAVASVSRLVVSKPAADAAEPSALCDPSAPPLAVTALNALWAADSRLLCSRERELLFGAGLRAASADVRRATVLSLGRLESPETIAVVLPMLKDSSPIVRGEAANALAQTVRAGSPEVTTVMTTLVAALTGANEPDAAAAGAMAEAVGRLPYTVDQAAVVGAFLVRGVAEGNPAPQRLLGMVKGLEALTRRFPRLDLGTAGTIALRRVSAYERAAAAGAAGDIAARIRRLGVQSLQNISDRDGATLLAAVNDPDWQVRRLGTILLGGMAAFGANAATNADPAAAAAMQQKLQDPAFQVRLEAIKVVARVATRTGDCQPLVDALGDASSLVALQAIDGLAPACRDLPAIVGRLSALSATLERSGAGPSWQLGARALTTLARVAPEQAATVLSRPAVVSHRTWQVRAAVAAAAGRLKNESVLLRLANDPVPNVRVAVLDGLRAMGSAALVATSTAALASDDFYLVRTAAASLKGATKSPEVTTALFAALDRLTAAGKDTSRDPRLALLERLTEQEPVALASRIQSLLTDFDPQVASAAQALHEKLAPGAGAKAAPRLRRPLQASPEAIASLPTTATMVMENGDRVELTLLINDAPMSVARFVSLARAGYYNNLTFHRIVPNFVVQGGSPGASEYVGDARYMRDELGVPNLRGGVGISTRGRDTGDAQIFINLVDLPRLDHDYTVFATVTSGIDAVDRILEGATIRSVVVR